MAFGTGHHGTTKGCLLALDKLISKGKKIDNVIDIGCGTAVLDMAVGKVSSSVFSSSGRHTGSVGDWWSDLCSSDVFDPKMVLRASWGSLGPLLGVLGGLLAAF